MPKRVLIPVLILATIFAASLGMLLAMRRTAVGEAAGGGDDASGFGPAGTTAARSSDPLVADENARELKIMPFELLNQRGVKIDNSVFNGKLTIVNFMFTHCTLVCPVLTQTMGDVGKRLREKGGPAQHVDLLSVSVDPKHDTPARLAEYATNHDADPRQWTFATGPTEVVYPLLENGLKFAVGPDPSEANLITLQDGTTMQNIFHPSWLVLVGPKGEVLGIYLSAIPEEMDALVARAAKGAEKLKLRE